MADKLPHNYDVATARHAGLRRTFMKLDHDVKSEFKKRLTDGLASQFWEIVSKKEETELKNSGKGHWLPSGIVLKEASSGASTKARLVLDPSSSYNQTLMDCPNIEPPIQKVLRRVQALPLIFTADIEQAFFKILLETSSRDQLLFVMDYDKKNKILTAEAGPNTELVTLRAKASIMGVKHSPLYLSLVKEDVGQEVKKQDKILSYHMANHSYVDDMQSGITAKEVAACQLRLGLQLKVDTCDDVECCPPDKDENNTGNIFAEAPQDEARASRHLLQGAVGKELAHSLCLRAATLETALRHCGMPTKGIESNFPMQTAVMQEAVKIYTTKLQKGVTPQASLLLNIPPPAGYALCPKGRWWRPWIRLQDHDDEEQPDDNDPVLRLQAPPSSSLANPTDEEADTREGSTLLGYCWNSRTDKISTGKSPWLNIHPARRGRRPAWARITEARDLLKIHKAKPLKERQALSLAHSHFDPVHRTPWVSVQLKMMYRYLILTSPATAGYETEVTEDFIVNHMMPAASAVLATKRLTAKRGWRLPLAINYADISFELDTLTDGCWGVTAGAATIVYLLQRYIFNNAPRVSIYLYSCASAMNPMRKLIHQVDAELAGFNLAAQETVKVINTLRDEGIAFKEGNVRMISDSQTGLSLACRAGVELDMGPGLTVSRIQEIFGNKGLFYAPGTLFSESVDLLTRYDPHLRQKIGAEFYAPSFLLPEVHLRATVPVEKMKKETALPHLCQKTHVWCKVADQLPANLLEVADTNSNYKGFNSTGKGPMSRKQKCTAPCFTCGTSSEEVHPRDRENLKAAEDRLKMPHKTKKGKGGHPSCWPPAASAASSSTDRDTRAGALAVV